MVENKSKKLSSKMMQDKQKDINGLQRILKSNFVRNINNNLSSSLIEELIIFWNTII